MPNFKVAVQTPYHHLREIVNLKMIYICVFPLKELLYMLFKAEHFIWGYNIQKIKPLMLVFLKQYMKSQKNNELIWLVCFTGANVS